MKNVTTIQNALDCVEKLLPEEQETLLEIVKKRIIEHRRNEIARNASDTINAVREGRATYGTVEDLKKDLLSDDL